MAKKGIKPKGVWFVGDGLNDAPCCRMVSEQGGVSCSMDCNDKSAFFTDITLNNSLNYLSEHKTLNKSLAQIITQNKGILIYSTLAFLAFIISFSIAGIAVSPLIPMAIMLSSTFFVLFNSYRTQLTVDTTLDQTSSWYKKLLSSNLSIGLLLTASTLLIGATLVATLATGTLALPILAFTAGAAMALSSACTLSSLTLLGLFMVILTAALLASPKSIISNPVEPAKPGLLNTPERDNDGTSENRKRAAGLNFFADPQQSTPPFLDNLMNHP
jgi:Cu+-exporting ATPase